jgi:SAM-dependent methyltransferase
VRTRLARKFLKGAGIEFGALNAPLCMPENVNVTYADIPNNDYYIDLAQEQYGHVTAPTIFADIEVMDGIPNESQDFVVANQVLEHVESPLRALRSISRVLRPSGVAFISLPDKRFSFDRKREITPLDHFIRDYEEGPDWSRESHYKDWAHYAEGLEGEAFRARVTSMLTSRANIHFHVWDFASMTGFFNCAGSIPDIGLDVLHSQQNRGEGVWILRKCRLAAG